MSLKTQTYEQIKERADKSLETSAGRRDRSMGKTAYWVLMSMIGLVMAYLFVHVVDRKSVV